MATDIIARGMAANAKKSVTELGNKVESEKWIGTKAEWEAVDKSTIKDGTIVYITDDKTVVLYDKAEMEKIAAKVAEDRTAAEIAAQTAQSIADSLPEDYTTAVGKIAENTAEIANVKLMDKELTRRVNALYDLGNGVTHKFETDSETAYQKAVPTGAKLMSVKSIGGHSEVIDGEIVSAGTEEIVEQGANLYYSTDMLKVGSDTYEYIANSYRCKAIKLKPNTTYTLSFTSDKTSEIILLMNVNTVVNSQPYLDFRKTSDNRSYRTGDNGCLYVGVYAGNGSVASADVVKRLSECKIMISEGDTPTAYAPYHSNVYPIPEAIRNLPGYGVEGNIVDYENKTYTQVNSVSGTEIVPLEKPIVTDISTMIPDDFLRNLTVEAGGSITFKNGNGDSYCIPVPSEEEYVVKLSEVGGSV